MVVDHASFPQPDDPYVKLWRYMDFTKFVALLETGGLYFARLDRLDDPLEGSWPRSELASREALMARVRNEPVPATIPDVEAHIREELAGWSRLARAMRVWTAVNCWHMSEFESAAMWALYSNQAAGVAVRTTFAALRDVLTEADETIMLGLVRYIDFDADAFPSNNMLDAITLKRRSYEYEREARAAICKFMYRPDGVNMNVESGPWSHGRLVRVDIAKLVQRIYVSPSAPEWFADLVRAVTGRYGLDLIPVQQSSLITDPVY